MEYPKIQTLFKRDEKNIIIPGSYTLDEFLYLENNLWEATEKIDGKNVRIEVEPIYDGDANESFKGNKLSIKGKTDNTQMPTMLMEKLNELFSIEKLAAAFPDITSKPMRMTLFGEGYGKKIQDYGSRYIKDEMDFIMFDVNIDGWWLRTNDTMDIARKLGIKHVPYLGPMTLQNALSKALKGFKSAIAEDESLEAEGIVLKAMLGIKDRRGNRIMTKIKTKDIRKWENASCKKFCYNPKVLN